MTTPRLPARFSSRARLVAPDYTPTREFYEFTTSVQHWTPQTAVLNAGVEAQISEVRYSLEAGERRTLQVQAELSSLRGDPRLEAGARAEGLAQQALFQAMARQDARFRQEIGELYGLVVALSQQVAETQQRQLVASQESAQATQRSELQVFITQAASNARIGATVDVAVTRIGQVESRLDTLTTTDVAEGSRLYFTEERVDDRVAALIQNGGGLTWTYDDGAGSLTGAVSLSGFDTDDLAEGSNLYFTEARARAAVSAGDGLDYSGGVFSVETRTGWTAPTGTASRATFDTATVTLPDLAQRVKALIDDLTTSTLIGA